MIRIRRLDHLVLTVADIERTCAFYHEVLGADRVEFGAGRVALRFGEQKINLHEAGREFEPKAAAPTPGSADLCFIIATPIAEAMHRLADLGVEVIEGPVSRTGATGPIVSIYLRDPDGNLLELANPVPMS